MGVDETEVGLHGAVYVRGAYCGIVEFCFLWVCVCWDMGFEDLVCMTCVCV